MKEALDKKKQSIDIQTEWSHVFVFGLVFTFYTYNKCYFFFEYGIYFDLFSEITGIILTFISIPIELALTISLLRKKYLKSHNIHTFITCTLYLIFAYSFAMIKPFDMSFSNFIHHFDAVAFIQSMVTIALYSIPISIVTILLVDFIAKNYQNKKPWHQNESSRS